MPNIDFLLNQSLADKNYETQVHWLIQVTHWLKQTSPLDNGKVNSEKILGVRLKFLLQILSRNEVWKKNFTANISSLLLKISSVHFFAEVGMTLRSAFLQDFISRLEEKVLPQSPITDDLSTLFFEMFDEEDSVAIDQIDEKVMNDFLSLFHEENNLSVLLQKSLMSSLLILSSHLLSGTFSLFHELSNQAENPVKISESKLQLEIISLIQKNDFSNLSLIHDYLSACENSRLQIYQKLQHQGVKVDTVYLIESQKRRIERMKNICCLLDPSLTKSLHVRLFLSQLILDLHHQRSLKSFFSENLGLITHRIVQGNSDIGEHYVTFNKSEFKHMYKSAVGGGGLTTITVFIKMAASALPLTGFLKGLIESLNYSGSFLFIHMMGWTLATKQPSATAPYLAQSLKRSLLESRRAVIALLRTQFIAVLGNLTLVFPLCLAISWIFMLWGHPVSSEAGAYKIFNSSSILGPSAIFAAFTGVLLFLSSLFAGWFANWVVIHKIPNRILTNQTVFRFFGTKGANALSKFISKNANALAGNISLGFLLGLTPQYLKFMGLPLEVRHITLATGQFATSLPILWQNGMNSFELTASVLGLLVIGILNISVSFSLALLLAAISSHVRFSLLWALIKWGIVLVLTRPWLLFIPEKDEQKPEN